MRQRKARFANLMLFLSMFRMDAYFSCFSIQGPCFATSKISEQIFPNVLCYEASFVEFGSF